MKFIVTLLSIIFLILIFGTVVYHLLEGWTWIDSLYFTTVTISTIGYGDIYPTHEITRLFTVFFIFIGVGTMFYSITAIFEHIVEKGIARRLPKHLKRLKLRQEPRWNFGGRSEIVFKIKMFFKNLGEKIEKFRNKHRVNY